MIKLSEELLFLAGFLAFVKVRQQGVGDLPTVDGQNTAPPGIYETL